MRDERRDTSGRGTQERGAGPGQPCQANASEFNPLWVVSFLGAKSIHGISQLAERFPMLHRQLYNECTLISSPDIAGDATGQPITIVIYLYKRRTAAVAATGYDPVTAG